MSTAISNYIDAALAGYDSKFKDLYSKVQCLEQSNSVKDGLISNLQEKNAELADKLSKVEDLTDRVATLDLAITGLARKQKSLSKDTSKKMENKNEQDFDGFKRISREHDACLSRMERKITSLSTEVDRLTTLQRVLNQLKLNIVDKEKMEEEMKASKQEIRALEAKIDGIVKIDIPAFSVSRFGGSPIELKQSETLYKMSDFTHVHVTSPHFSMDTGNFTAPYRGVYGFHLTVWKRGDGEIKFGVRWKDKFYFTIFSGDDTGDRNAMYLVSLGKNEVVDFNAKLENGSAQVKSYRIYGWLVAKQ